MSVQAVSKHLRVLEDAGLVTRRREAQRRPVHLEAEVFDLMTTWIERYRRQAEERYRRLDALPCGRRCPTNDPKEKHRMRGQHHEIIVDEKCRWCASSGSSTPRPRRSSGPTSTPSCSSSGTGPRATRCGSTTSTAGPAGPTAITSPGRQGVRRPRLVPRRVPDELIVQTFTPEGAPELVVLEKHRFEDLGDGRTRLTAHVAGRQLRVPRLVHRRGPGRGLRPARPAPRGAVVPGCRRVSRARPAGGGPGPE